MYLLQLETSFTARTKKFINILALVEGAIATIINSRFMRVLRIISSKR